MTVELPPDHTPTGASTGAGNAAKQAVVLSSVIILVSDFFITKIFVVFR